ncbi:uncharacterized protein LOC131650164 [Vicia villosa]|uniref:uncharacterized protein LOC131650164 n=1 Tax=Vicia villosa TaxID=3911 RepID=UPI00273B8074|nr:uncharacterized protein LOC131650164 [Vicia villosa]
MKQMLTEYNVTQNVMTLYCDNLSAINISKNPIQHSRTKHLDIRHHFIRELVEDKVIYLEHVSTELQLADIFTKALDATQFENLRWLLIGQKFKFPPLLQIYQTHLYAHSSSIKNLLHSLNYFIFLTLNNSQGIKYAFPSKLSKISQSSKTSSPKKMFPIADPESVPRTEPVNPNEVLDVAPLRIVTTNYLDVNKTRTPHARIPKDIVHGKVSYPSSSTPHEDLTKEGSEYAHNSIAKIVMRILDEKNKNLEPNVEPREDIIGKSTNDDDVHMSGGDAHMDGDDVHTPDDDVQMAKEEENDDIQKDDDNADVTQDVSDNTEAGPEAAAGTNIVNLDDLSYSDLVANVNPSIAKCLMTRRGKKAIDLSSPKRKAALKSTSTGPIKRKEIPKSNSAGPIKSKVVSKCTSVAPTKSWSKVVPKKKKAKVIADSDSNVVAGVQDIPLRKKPITSKLAASVPEVPIDNISFQYPASVNRWKYVYQKRLALERELAQNALECKEIMDLIHKAGIMKTVTHFSKCYEMLVKEFIVNISEDCADRKSKDFRKVYVRGKCVTFSSTVINNYLGRSDEAQPELEVKSWPLKGKLSASKLSIKYAMLHKIGAANWVLANHKSIVATVLGKFIYVIGTKTKFDYGSYIFDQTMKHVGSFSVKGPIAFPSLICGIILNYYPSTLSENDSVGKRESTLSFHYKLFQGTHVPDIVMTSAETSKRSSNASKAEVITMLKETCKELETRKLNLEKLISSLEMDEDHDFTVVAEEEHDGVGNEREAGSDVEVEADASPDDGTDEEADGDASSGSEPDD